MSGLFGGKKLKIIGFVKSEDTNGGSNSNNMLEDKRAEDGTQGDSDSDDNKYKKKKGTELLSIWLSLLILSFCLTIFALVLYMDSRLPVPLRVDNAENKYPDRFIEERARDLLKQLTSVGARPAGSYENEVLAVDFIRRRLETIQKKAKDVHKLTIDVQKPRGSFNLPFVDGLSHSYRDITNIIVKLESETRVSNNALLVNCHFDSVPQSPGASDDAVSCAIMLEVLDVLTQSEEVFKNNFIFLFNGAEENMLPASHGFITQHKWAEEARAFINLEACGAGGRELVFQSGPNHPWLIKAYANAAPHPFASVIGQEIFQSGAIPGDTDFRIFRDYGNIPGLDIAYVKNGYIYHTKYDTEDRIPSGSIQRAGDNVLAVVKYLGHSNILAHTEESNKGSVVFFDLLGLCLVYYPEWIGIILNIAVVSISIGSTVNKAKNSFQYGVTSKMYLSQLGFTFLIQLMGCVASYMVVTVIAFFLDTVGRTMSWYGRPWWIFFLYMTPTVMAVTAVFDFFLPQQKKYFQFADGVWVIESLYFEVSKLIWTLFTLVMTILGLKSSFFCMIWVFFPMTGRFILEYVYDRTAVQRKPKDWKWLAIHLISLAIPLTMIMYLIYMTFLMFIPIMGRYGSSGNPEFLIGWKSTFMTLATLSFICPLFMVMKKSIPYIVPSVLNIVTVISVILVTATPLGFPYSANPNSLAPHRSLVLHTAREMYDKSGNKFKDDSGYFVVNLDRNSPNVLYGHVGEFNTMSDITDRQCKKYLYCGVPVYYPCSSMLKLNNWIVGPKPKIFRDTNITLIQMEELSPHNYRFLFQASGPDHMGIYISPVSGVKLNTWSFSNGELLEGPTWKDNRPTYYIFYSHGLAPTPWTFWLDFKVHKDYIPEKHNVMDLAITGHIIHGNGMKSSDFKAFLSQYPDWSFPVGWTSSYKSFVF